MFIEGGGGFMLEIFKSTISRHKYIGQSSMYMAPETGKLKSGASKMAKKWGKN